MPPEIVHRFMNANALYIYPVRSPSPLCVPNVACRYFQETRASMHDEGTSLDHGQLSAVRGTIV